MRDQLLKEITIALMSCGIDPDVIKSKLVMILSNYEISKRTTEISVINEDDTSKYIRLFIINKRVAGRTERTVNHYKDELNKFFREVQKSPINVTSDDIKLYLAMKEVRDGSSKVYLQNMLRVISSFYQWMTKEEHITKNPMNKVDGIKIPKVKKHAFSEIEIELLRNRITDLRDKALLEVLLSTWCRVSEISNMNVEDIKSDNSMEVLGKGQKMRKVYLNAKAIVAIDDYLKSRTDSNKALFVSKDKPYNRLQNSAIEIITRNYGKDCGIENCHPHRFRRTGATFALKRGMPIEQVSTILGHESIETTQIYLDISEDDVAMAHRKYAG